MTGNKQNSISCACSKLLWFLTYANVYFVLVYNVVWFLLEFDVLIHRTVRSRPCSASLQTWWPQCTCVSSTSVTGLRRNILSTTWTLATSAHCPSWSKMDLSVSSGVTGMLPFLPACSGDKGTPHWDQLWGLHNNLVTGYQRFFPRG
jgi:hypothetical protein